MVFVSFGTVEEKINKGHSESLEQFQVWLSHT